MQVANSIERDIQNEHSESMRYEIDKKAFRRPIRALSYKVYSALSKFPTVSVTDRRVHANRVRKDIRESTSCSLEEWESLVQHVTSRLQLPVQHEPSFCLADVPRYDTSEMCIQFPTVAHLLRVFRHLTRSNLRELTIKRKIRRRRKRKVESTGRTGTDLQMIQVLGDYISEFNVFSFVIGGCFLDQVQLPPTYRYPVLFRESLEWNDLDRLYEDDMELRMMERCNVERMYNDEGAGVPQRLPKKSAIKKGGRKRIRESFFGFKWIRGAEQDSRTVSFHSFNACDVHGELHFCVPSTVFIGDIYAKDINRLLDRNMDIFRTR